MSTTEHKQRSKNSTGGATGVDAITEPTRRADRRLGDDAEQGWRRKFGSGRLESWASGQSVKAVRLYHARAASPLVAQKRACRIPGRTIELRLQCAQVPPMLRAAVVGRFCQHETSLLDLSNLVLSNSSSLCAVLDPVGTQNHKLYVYTQRDQNKIDPSGRNTTTLCHVCRCILGPDTNLIGAYQPSVGCLGH